MNIGMLWFDNDTKSALSARIQRAAEYYRAKYGAEPDVCFVHPSMISSPAEELGVELRTTQRVLPNHFWLGVKQH